MVGIKILAVVLGVVTPCLAAADDTGLFNADGYRASRYRAPVPDQVQGAETLSVDGVRQRISQGWIPLDVTGVGFYDINREGEWFTPEEHFSLPGARWLPVVGQGSIQPWQAQYLDQSLMRMTGGKAETGLIVFCKVDCWLSWNAVRRISAMGYPNLGWFPGGTELWEESGQPLTPVVPEPFTGEWSR